MQNDVKLREPALSTLTRVADAAVISLAHQAAMWLRSDNVLVEARTLSATLSAITVFSMLASASGLYHPALHSVPSGFETGKVWMAWGLTVAILMAIAIPTRAIDDYSRIVTLAWFLLTPWLLAAFRTLLRKVHGAVQRRAEGSVR